MEKNFIRFFDKEGSSMNLATVEKNLISRYDSSSTSYESLSGTIFFPEVSTGLIETESLYMLQEVTGPSTKFELRKVPGTLTTVGGNPIVTGLGTSFGDLPIGSKLKIEDNDYTVLSVAGATGMQVSPTPAQSTTTQNVYLYDYLNYNELRSYPGAYSEKITVRFPEKAVSINTTFTEQPFFIYEVDFTEDVPFIQKGYSATYDLVNGTSDSIDSLTGRVSLPSVNTLPLRIHLGISSNKEYIYEQKFEIVKEREFRSSLVSAPTSNASSVIFTVNGTSHSIFTDSKIYLINSASGYTKELNVTSVGTSGGHTVFTVNSFDSPVSSSDFASYSIKWVNFLTLASLDLYGEVTGEDERLREVLNNFGKRIDHDKEYIFRDSDINEDNPDYLLLNKKRKEMLLEGDNIYPYLGSYRALVNIINYFGYYDLRIKEYFLNVDSNSPNYGKYMHLLIPRNEEQRNLVKEAWKVVPSKIYKKTSLFGLFYDLNKSTDEEDIHGIPEVVDAFDFSPDEVLIKLFGLKELLKKEFLPLNARIFDITGEGIYFERIRIGSWSDNLNYVTLDLGKRPVFEMLPKEGHVNDIRRLDSFYVKKFTEQGLTGFSGSISTTPLLTAAGSTGPISAIYGTSLDSYNDFLDVIYDENGNLNPPVDPIWQFMPPSISDPNYNLIAARSQPLPDSEGVLAAAPLLLESFFDISWEESVFNWSQLAVLGPTGAPVNINIWTWSSIGRGEYIDMRWTIEKRGKKGFFYDSGRQPIDSFVVQTVGPTAFSLPGRVSVDIVNGSVADVQIESAGYGYTSSPSVFIPGPGTFNSLDANSSGTTIQVSNTTGIGIGMVVSVVGGTGSFSPGTTVTGFNGNSFTVSSAPLVPLVDATVQGTGTAASIALTVSEGYITGATWSAGSGYNYSPYVTVDPPATTYEKVEKILHTVALPYDGEYNVALYNYDITNNYTVEFKKYTVKNNQADFLSVFRRETPERNWEEFSKVSWKEIGGPWYYPIHTRTATWEQSMVAWESLDFASYKDTTLYEYPPVTSIYSINRENPSVILTGNLTGALPVAFKLNVGDYLFFTREENELVVENLQIPVDSLDTTLKGTIGGVTSDAFLSGSIGSYTVSTDRDVTSSISAGSSIWIWNSWYKVKAVSATTITLETPLIINFSYETALYYSNNTVTTSYIGNPSGMQRYSRLLLTDNCSYSSIDPVTDLYAYVDGTSLTSSKITFVGDDLSLRKLITANSSSVGFGNKELYASWGFFSGTYAVEITNISKSGNNTLFRLADPNKELYYLDGNFKVNLADFDVDYAETRIGTEGLKFGNLDELTWDENPALTWFGAEYHGEALCGFNIPFVAPGGSITVDEEPTFFFSGNVNINSTKPGLTLALSELGNSENSGISKYTYDLLPQEEIYIKDSSGTNLRFAGNFSVGATAVFLDGVPSGKSVKIPAKVSVTVSNGSIDSVTIDEPGYGYTQVPTVTLSQDACGGTPAVITLQMSGLPFDGKVTGATFTGGTGYTGTLTATVSPPDGFRPFDNFIWTGSEWLEVTGVSGVDMYLKSPNKQLIFFQEHPLLPYEYHKQIFLNPEHKLQHYYYFIQGKAKNSSLEMLSYLNLGNGVESEWSEHPGRTYTYPLKNTLLEHGMMQTNVLDQDHLFKTWSSEGEDYPPVSIHTSFESDRLSYKSRIPFAGAVQCPFSFIDTVSSPLQEMVLQYTPVVFHYDNCRVPGKNSPEWTLTDEKTGKIVAVSRSKKFMWTFTRTGSFSLSLSVKDTNGNVSFTKKNSFVIVREIKELA